MERILVKVEKNQKVFFTSDLHFGHKNICKPTFANRPWDDVKQMGAGLISRWNSVVTSNDIVFVLGDVFWFNNSKEIKKITEQLNGKMIYIVPGNHDDVSAYHRVDPDRVVVLDSEVMLHLQGVFQEKPSKMLEMYLSHCPMATWPHRERGSVNLFGHIHSGPRVNPENSDADITLWKGMQYDVGVDNNDYTPISLAQVFVKLSEQLESKKENVIKRIWQKVCCWFTS